MVTPASDIVFFQDKGHFLQRRRETPRAMGLQHGNEAAWLPKIPHQTDHCVPLTLLFLGKSLGHMHAHKM
jgi:hypothetical protein